ncbi:hypothetical protein AC579_6911 [Pseudocercospora musae]|uniref:Uncharacterized protein n=1 Tax=Pseudocercospora musae TaxID=113226 RepID=A0A139GTI5_9PEZI|nr:hypothetical protein AC579_6911 [Pseudocercospora musae]
MPPADAASFRRYRSSHERTTAMERGQVGNSTWDEIDKMRDSVDLFISGEGIGLLRMIFEFWEGLKVGVK